MGITLDVNIQRNGYKEEKIERKGSNNGPDGYQWVTQRGPNGDVMETQRVPATIGENQTRKTSKKPPQDTCTSSGVSLLHAH